MVDFLKCWHVLGHQVILTVPVSQSISGLWCFSDIYLRIIWFCPRSVISAVTCSLCPWYVMVTSVQWVICPAEFFVPSTLYTEIGWHRGHLGSPFSFTHFLSINITFAPLSSSAFVGIGIGILSWVIVTSIRISLLGFIVRVKPSLSNLSRVSLYSESSIGLRCWPSLSFVKLLNHHSRLHRYHPQYLLIPQYLVH